MDRKVISQALSGIEEKYIIEALELSGRAYAVGKDTTMNRRSFSRPARVALIAAVLAMVLGISAGAYVGFVHYESPAEMIRGFFGADNNKSGVSCEKFGAGEIVGELRARLREGIILSRPLEVDEELMERFIYPFVGDVDASFDRGDYTVTLEACFYDKNILGGLLYYSVENPNGIEGYRLTEHGYLELTNGVYVGLEYKHNIYVDAERSTDTKLYLCERFIIDPAQRELLDPKLSVGSGPTSAGISFEPVIKELEQVDVPGVEFAGGNIRLSPIGIMFKPEAVGSGQGKAEYVALRFDDGSEYVVYDLKKLLSNSVCNLNVDGWAIHLFNSVVDIDSVAEVLVADAVFGIE